MGTPKDTLYFWGKGVCKQKSEHYFNNAISNAKFSGTPRDTVYSRGKGINKQKTNKQIKCVCLVKRAVDDVGQQGVLGIVQIKDKQQSDAQYLQG